jgi:hypothetical protein
MTKIEYSHIPYSAIKVPCDSRSESCVGNNPTLIGLSENDRAPMLAPAYGELWASIQDNKIPK